MRQTSEHASEQVQIGSTFEVVRDRLCERAMSPESIGKTKRFGWPRNSAEKTGEAWSLMESW